MSAEAASNPDFQSVSGALSVNIEKNHIEVPMLPEVAGRVVRLTQDPDSSAQELANLIQSDQSLAGHVMRVANSAAYSPNSSMVSLQQAITRLGMKLIAEIALAASINSSMFNTPGYEKHIQYEMRFSLASGLWAKEIARVCRRNVEAAFLAGLLHDIGRPVTVQATLEIAKQLKVAVSKIDMKHIEDEFHRIIGIKVVEQWEMPTSVVNVIRFFDNYLKEHKEQNQTMIVVAGVRFASHFMCDEDMQGKCLTMEELKNDPVLADLNLYDDEVQQILDREEQVRTALEAMTQ